MKVKKLFSLLVVMIMVFAMTTTAFAASSSTTVTSLGTMSLYLAPSTSGNSNVITFNVSGLPTGAIVTKVVVDASANISWSGQGAIVSNSLYIKNSTMTDYVSAPWGSGNKTEVTTGLIGKPAAGTWSIYYNGTNVSSFYDALKSYKNVKLTVYYNY